MEGVWITMPSSSSANIEELERQGITVSYRQVRKKAFQSLAVSRLYQDATLRLIYRRTKENFESKCW